MTTEITEVQITFWRCGKGHLHKSLEAAERCVTDQVSRKKRPDLTARNAAIFCKAIDGATYRSLAEEYGLHYGTVRGIWQTMARTLLMYKQWQMVGRSPELFDAEEVEALSQGYEIRDIAHLRKNRKHAEVIKRAARKLAESRK